MCQGPFYNGVELDLIRRLGVFLYNIIIGFDVWTFEVHDDVNLDGLSEGEKIPKINIQSFRQSWNFQLHFIINVQF